MLIYSIFKESATYDMLAALAMCANTANKSAGLFAADFQRTYRDYLVAQ